MTSSETSANTALSEYAAGRLTAQQLVGAVAAAYYENRGGGSGEWLRPVMDVIERAHPGIVELSGSNEKPGFVVRLAERPFPKRWEPALREAAAAVEGTATNRSPLPTPSFFARIVGAIRSLFSA